jgi:hypothetical protein
MRINRSLENEETWCAGGEWHSDCYQCTLTRSEDTARGAEADVSGDVGGGRPVQVTLIARPGKHTRETDVCAIFLAVEVSNNAHGGWT